MGPSQTTIEALAAGSILAITIVAVVSLVITAPRRSGRQAGGWRRPSPEGHGSGSGPGVGSDGAGAGQPEESRAGGPGRLGPAPAPVGSWPPAGGGGPAGSAVKVGGPSHMGAFDFRRTRQGFGDVAGQSHAIDELREIADYLSDPERFAVLGAELPRGILLHGPPGCGKTLLARALAGETGVPFYSISAASFVEQYVGLGAARVRQLFESAAKHPRSIIFIDELDAIGRSRNDGAGGGAEFDHTLNQLLVELDGFAGSSGALVLGATNRLELLDAALLRPGRFDRRIRIEPPDCDGRRAILELHARRRPFSPQVDWARVAAHTAGLAPADLANIVNEAALLAGRAHRQTISPDDVEDACVRQVSGTAASHLIEDGTRWLLAVHEAGHAVLAQLLRDVSGPARISILGRGDAYDRSVWAAGEAREVLNKRELIARLILLLGGRAAEVNLLGQPSTQAADDLAHAATMARRMVERWGMTGRFDLAGGQAGTRPAQMVEGTAGGEEVRRLVAGAEAAARTILADHRSSLLRVARILAERETLSAEEVAALTGTAIGARASPGGGPAAAPAPAPATRPVVTILPARARGGAT